MNESTWQLTSLGFTWQLTELGFKKVTGLYESVDEGFTFDRIEKQAPLTWDANNGVIVVYDDDGDPWVRRTNYNRHGWDIIKAFLCARRIRRGAYVPMSNDGGYAIRAMFR